MSRFNGALQTTAQAYAATTIETLLQLVAAANHRVALTQYGMGARGTSNTDEPGVVDVLRQTTAGTSSAQGVVKKDNSLAETLLSSGLDTFTAEPITDDVLRTHTIHPQSVLVIQDSFGSELIVGGGDRMGIRATFQQAQTIDGYIDFEE